MNEIKFVLISLYRSVSMGGCLDFRGGISHKLFMLVTATINIRKAEEDNVEFLKPLSQQFHMKRR